MQPLHTKDRDAIVQEFLDYIIGFVEQPRPELGDLPVCPFSRGARLEGRMRIEVIELNVEAITAQLPCFQRDPHLEMLLCVHPHRGPPSCAEVYDLAKELNRSLLALNLVALAGHPSIRSISTVSTRGESRSRTSSSFGTTLGNEPIRALRKRPTMIDGRRRTTET